MTIHPTAVVDAGARLADGVEVGPYCVIGDGVEIGPDTRLGPHVVVRGPTVVGRGNRIFQFASVGDAPQDRKYAGERTRLVIGDRNTVREGCTLNRGTAQDAGETRIGDDNWIMAYVHVAHDCVVGNHNVLANNVTLAGHVHVGDRAILGGFTGVHQYCRIGSHAFLGMFSGIHQDVPAYCTVTGEPARPRGINSEGLRRHGFTAEQVANIKRAYRTLYRSGLKFADAVEAIAEAAAGAPELEALLSSLRASTRGIVR